MKIGIIGGGPAGYASALLAGILGGDVTLFEKDRVGGVCLNRGCIPVKALIKVAKGLNTIKKIKASGIDAALNGIDWASVKKTAELASRRLVIGVERLLEKRNVKLVNSEAELKDNCTVVLKGKEFSFDKVLIATGSIPRRAPFETDKGVWTSDEALNASSVPEDIGIVGGGVIGLEFAYIFRSFGSNVVVYEVMDEILPFEDRGMATLLRRELEKSGIKFKLGVQVKRIKKSRDKFNLVYVDKGKECKSEHSKVLVSVGRELSRAGIPDSIALEKGFLKVDKRLETNLDNVFAAGDCIGGFLLAHTAYYEAEVAVKNIMGMDETLDESSVPRVIYTKPEFASCGMPEEALKERGIDFSVEFFRFSGNGRAVAECDTVGGVKIIFDKNGKILGGAIIGGYASEMIHIISMGMRHNLSAEDIFTSIFAHPTYSEGIREAAGSFLGLPIHS